MNTPAAIAWSSRLARRAIQAGALLCLIGSAHGASTIYRCGAAGNHYSDQPCADGRPLDIRDERSESQRAEATRVAMVERRYAAELQRERLLLEAAAPRVAAGLSSRPAAMPRVIAVAAPIKRHSRARGPRPLSQGDDFFAFIPAPRRAH